ncbi:TetR/AcrR family transcriptional regulator [Nocardia sputorum]|uniref:TetR family transcriptional regulator n=1 Tax=Nocardia sputorum TaxID=2984338 RepID=A0ABN6U970_9NOCA|nr:TetR/AcrR family transcriptional regulator [Nocardia sputorum]BDU01658.1 TetR family transcriptional regulator [Nocardia sputorum]
MPPPKPERPTGRIDKRQAILDAAFTLFSRDGYHQAGVDTIAVQARVAKHTIYNHFGDKETLFRAVIADLSEQALTRNLAAVEILDRSGDLATLLTESGLRLAECYCDERSVALRRLLHANMPNMPDLLDIVKDTASDRVDDALSARLAKLALAGKLNIVGDPAIAAEHLAALLAAPLEARTRMGTRRISESELREVTRNAVATFLRAFGGNA